MGLFDRLGEEIPQGDIPLDVQVQPASLPESISVSEPNASSMPKFLQDRNAVELPSIDISQLPKAYNAYQNIPADTASKAYNIAKENNYNFSSVAMDINKYEQADTKDRIYNTVTEINDNGDFKYPKIINYLSDPVNAAIVKGDTDELIALDKAINTEFEPSWISKAYKSLESGINTMNANVASLPGALVDIGNIIPNIGSSLGNRIFGTDTPQVQVPDYIIDNPLSQFYDARAEEIRPEALNESAIAKIAEGDYAGAAENISLQVINNLPNQMLIGAGVMLGMGTSTLAAMGSLQASAANKEGRESGKTPLQNQLNSTISGILEGLFERVGTFGALNKWGEIAKTTGKQGFSSLLGDITKKILYSFGAEFNEEFNTEITQGWSDYITGNKNAMEGIFPRALEAGLIGGFSGVGLTSPMGMSRMVVKSNQINNDIKRWDAIEKLSTESKLKAKNPEKFTELVESLSKESDTPDSLFFHISDVKSFFTEDVNSESPSNEVSFNQEEYNNFIAENNLQDQVIAAEATGQDFEVPVAKWATNNAGSDLSLFLRDRMRFDRDGMSVLEQNELTQDLQIKLEEAKAEYTELAKEAELPTQLETIRNQLMLPKEQGGFQLKADDADAQLAVFMAGATQLSKQTGENIQEWFDRVAPQLNIGGTPIATTSVKPETSTDGITYNQSGEINRDENFKKFFAGSKVVDEQGEPLVVYHGTNAKFDSFDVDKMTTTAHGRGFYFASKKETAEGYRNQSNEDSSLLETYLSMEQPLSEDTPIFNDSEIRDILKRTAELEAEYDEGEIVDTFLSNYSYGDIDSMVEEALEAEKDNENAIDFMNSLVGGGALFDFVAQAVKDVTGYDGIEVFIDEDIGTYYIAFSPNQIKSATANKGTFDTTDPNIYNQTEQISLDRIKQTAEDKNVKLDVYEKNDNIGLSRIVVPKENRQQGVGTEIINNLISYADQNDKTITLTPSKDFGATSVSRLKKYYKGLGFIENKGKNKDFTISDSMYKLPSKDILNQDQTRGSVQFTEAATIISLYDSANFSTFLHEIGHVFMKESQNIIDAGLGTEKFVGDYKILSDFAGDITTRKGQEKLARGFESYLRDGKAPSVALTSAFRRLKAWMTAIYKSIKQLDVKVSKEVSEVFDRLLASEKDITNAQEYYEQKTNLMSLLKPTEAAKLKADKLFKKSKETAEDKLASLYMNAYIESRGGLKQLEASAKEQIMEEPIYKAIYDAVENESVDYNEVSELYGEKTSKQLKYVHPSFITKKGTNSLSQLAMEYDFESVDAFLETLLATEKREKQIKKNVENELIQKEKDIRETVANEDSGVDAIHNNDSLDYLILEAVELSKKKSNKKNDFKRLNNKLYKDAAEQTIGQKKVYEAGRYDIFAKTEQKFANLALKETRSGNYEKAYEAKQKQILNHALVQAAIKARDVKLKIEKSYQTTKINKQLNKVEDSFREVALNYIETYKLNRDVSPKNPDSVPNIEDMDQGLFALIPEWIMNRTLPQAAPGRDNLVPYRNLSFDNLVALDSSIKSIMYYGRGELKSLQDAKIKTIQEAVDTSVEAMSNLKDKKVNKEFTLAKTLGDVTDSVLSYTNMVEFLFERADNYEFTKDHEFGVLRKMFNTGVEAESEYQQIKEDIMTEATQHFDNLYKANKRIQKELGKSFDIGIPMIPEMERHGRAWTVERMIAVMLNTGNLHNKAVVMNAYNINQTQLDHIFSFFTSDEIQSIQGLWDTIDTLWKPLSDKHFDLYNNKLSKVNSEKQTVISKDGASVELEGGYYPLAFDSVVSDKAGRISEEKDIMKARKQAVYRSKKSDDSMTKERTDKAHSLPPSLSLGVFFTHISDTARFISHSAYLSDLNKLTLNSEWRNSFKVKFGDKSYKLVSDWIAYQANPERNINGIFEKALDKSKNMASVGILGLNLSVGIKQRLSMFGAMKEIGIKEILKAYTELDIRTSALGLSNTEAWNNILKVSPYMKARQGNIDREMSDSLHKFNPIKKRITIMGKSVTSEDIKAFSFAWIQMNDRATVGIVWQAAYNKYFKENMQKTDMTEDQMKKDAVTKADSIVRTTQPSTLPIDLNAAQRSEGAMRLFTAFMTWTFKWGNRMSSQNKAWREGGISTKEYGKHFLYEVLFSPWGSMLIGSMLYNGELPEWWEWLTSPMENTISWMPIVREIPGTFKYGRDIGTPTGTLPFSQGVKAAKSTYAFINDKKKLTDLAWDMGTISGTLAGLPVLNVAKDIVKAVNLVTDDKKSSNKKSL